MKEYICRSNAVVTWELDSPQPSIMRVLASGQRVQALELAIADNGQERVRTVHGWVSLVAGSGEVLLEPVDCLDLKPSQLPHPLKPAPVCHACPPGDVAEGFLWGAQVMQLRRARNHRLRREKTELVDFVLGEVERRHCQMPPPLGAAMGVEQLSIERLLSALSGGAFTATDVVVDLAKPEWHLQSATEYGAWGQEEKVVGDGVCFEMSRELAVTAAFECFLRCDLPRGRICKLICVQLGIPLSQYRALARHACCASSCEGADRAAAAKEGWTPTDQMVPNAEPSPALGLMNRNWPAIEAGFREHGMTRDGCIGETEFCKSLQTLGVNTRVHPLPAILSECRRGLGKIDCQVFRSRVKPTAEPVSSVAPAYALSPKPPPNRCSVGYLLELVSWKRPNDFNTHQGYAAWLHRQLKVVSTALDTTAANIVAQKTSAWGHLAYIDIRHMEIDGIRVMLQAMFRELVDIGCKPADSLQYKPVRPPHKFRDDAFAACLAAINDFIIKMMHELMGASRCSTDPVAIPIIEGLGIEFPLNTNLYEILVGAAFDSERPGVLAANHQELFGALTAVRHALRITDGMHLVCLLHVVFQDLQTPDFLSTRCESITLLHSFATLLQSAEGTEHAASEMQALKAERRYRTAVLTHIAEFCRGSIQGIQWTALQNLDDGSGLALRQLVGSYVAVAAHATEADQVEVAAELLRMIAGEYFDELVAQLGSDVGSLAWLAEAATAAMQVTPALQAVCGRLCAAYCDVPAEIVFAALAARLRREYEACHVVTEAPVLSADVIHCLGAFHELEDLFARHGAGLVWGGPIASAGSPFAVLISSWVVEQRRMFDGMLALEVAKGTSREGAMSAVDVCVMFLQALSFYDSLRLSGDAWCSCLLQLVEVIAQTACRFAGIQGQQLSHDEIPPTPDPRKPLRPGWKPGAHFPGGRTSAVGSCSAPAFQDVYGRLWRLQDFPAHLDELQAYLHGAWERALAHMRSHEVPPPAAAEGRKRVEHLLAGVRRLLETTHRQLLELLAAKVVYSSLRRVFLDALYLPSTTACRFHHLRVEVATAIAEVSAAVPEQLVREVVGELRTAFLSGLERVLLDGGPGRVFAIEDYELLQEDCVAVLVFFAEMLDGIDILALNPDLRVDTKCGRCEVALAVCCSAAAGLMCLQCSAVVHQGRWRSHRVCVFAADEPAERLRATVRLFAVPSPVLADALKGATVPAFDDGAPDPHVVGRILAHRMDDIAQLVTRGPRR
jgi:hypothetical protein